MGNLGEDLVKISMVKGHASELIKEFQKIGTCNFCGKHFDSTKGGICQKTSFWNNCNANLCPKCMKICKYCKKVFCPEHINNHKCVWQEDDKNMWECAECGKEFELTIEGEEILKEKGEIKIKCPYCKKEQVCEK